MDWNHTYQPVTLCTNVFPSIPEYCRNISQLTEGQQGEASCNKHSNILAPAPAPTGTRMCSSNSRTGPEMMARSGTAQITPHICSGVGWFLSRKIELLWIYPRWSNSGIICSWNKKKCISPSADHKIELEKSLATVTPVANTHRTKHCYHWG